MDFSQLDFGKEEPKVQKVPPIPKQLEPLRVKSGPLNYQDLVEERQVVQVKLTKEEIERRRTTEPGYKIPVGNYQQIAQWCETCGDVQTHVHSPEKQKLRCLNCKNDKYYGKE